MLWSIYEVASLGQRQEDSASYVRMFNVDTDQVPRTNSNFSLLFNNRNKLPQRSKIRNRNNYYHMNLFRF